MITDNQPNAHFNCQFSLYHDTLHYDTVCNHIHKHIKKSHTPLIVIAYTCIKSSDSLLNYNEKLSVRQLFYQLLDTIKVEDTLNEQNYPYKLSNLNNIVSFSHSNSQNKCKQKEEVNFFHYSCAVAINLSQKTDDNLASVGTDIENKAVPWSVCQRFFHSEELQLLSEISKDLKQKLCNVLWQTKECLIKIHQSSLAKGLGVNCSCIIKQYINQQDNNEMYVYLTNSNFINKTATVYINQELHMVVVF